MTYPSIKVRLQLYFEIDFKYDTQEAKKLCDVFGFTFEVEFIDEKNKLIFINIYYVCDPLLGSGYSEIIKTFALQNGYLLLGSEITDIVPEDEFDDQEESHS